MAHKEKQIMPQHERRKDTRLPLHEGGFLIHRNETGGQELIPVTISNVSFNGASLHAAAEVKKETAYELKYSILHRSFTFPVKVMWSRFIKDRCYIGCQKVTV